MNKNNFLNNKNKNNGSFSFATPVKEEKIYWTQCDISPMESRKADIAFGSWIRNKPWVLTKLSKYELDLKEHKKNFKCVLNEMQSFFKAKEEVRKKLLEEKQKIESKINEEKWNQWQEEWKRQDDIVYKYNVYFLGVNKEKTIIPKRGIFAKYSFSALNTFIPAWMPSESLLMFENLKKIVSMDWRIKYCEVMEEMVKYHQDQKLLNNLKNIWKSQEDKEEEKEEDTSVDVLVPIVVDFSVASSSSSSSNFSKRNELSDDEKDGFTRVVYKKKSPSKPVNVSRPTENPAIVFKSQQKREKREKTKKEEKKCDDFTPSEEMKSFIFLDRDFSPSRRETNEEKSYSKILTTEQKEYQEKRSKEIEEEMKKKNEINRERRRNRVQESKRENIRFAAPRRGDITKEEKNTKKNSIPIVKKNKREITSVGDTSRNSLSSKKVWNKSDSESKDAWSEDEEKCSPKGDEKKIVTTVAPWASLISSLKELRSEIKIEINIPYGHLPKGDIPSSSSSSKNQVKLKTQWCTFSLKGKCNRKCCDFAHNIKEFNPTMCRFREKCKYISQGCYYLHPKETKEDVCRRCNYPK